MSTSGTIVIVDTSVFLNVLDVPDRNQNRGEVITVLGACIGRCDLLLPWTAVLETGNAVAKISDGRVRRERATLYRTQVLQAITGEAPWKPAKFPDAKEIATWLSDFPNQAMQGIGMGDMAIIGLYEQQKAQFHSRRVKVWTLETRLPALGACDTHPALPFPPAA